MADVRQRPTRHQLETLIAYIEVGSIAAAAHELGISATTARQHLSGLYRRTGCLNAAQAAYQLGRAESAGGARSQTLGSPDRHLRESPPARGGGQPSSQSGDRWSKSSRSEVSISRAVNSSKVPYRNG